ncbi:hypothetical protein HU200_044106 [Digitaria exilis]|uniref:Disease resistance N-terminal domain-containing protein n=1 Tax=Digitaria exilis TaxID=1010633 RepID=A0A835EGV0_9POAL|nr:hypothetical protein HU200_044106 [Digitaria exilis]
MAVPCASAGHRRREATGDLEKRGVEREESRRSKSRERGEGNELGLGLREGRATAAAYIGRPQRSDPTVRRHPRGHPMALACRCRANCGPRPCQPFKRAVPVLVPRAGYAAQAQHWAWHGHGTSTVAIGPCRVRVVPFRAVLVPAQRAKPVWPPIDYQMQKGMRHQIAFLKDELSSMNKLLERLADMEVLDPQTCEWRNQVREMTYEIEDCVDDYMGQPRNGPQRCWGCGLWAEQRRANTRTFGGLRPVKGKKGAQRGLRREKGAQRGPEMPALIEVQGRPKENAVKSPACCSRLPRRLGQRYPRSACYRRRPDSLTPPCLRPPGGGTEERGFSLVLLLVAAELPFKPSLVMASGGVGSHGQEDRPLAFWPKLYQVKAVRSIRGGMSGDPLARGEVPLRLAAMWVQAHNVLLGRQIWLTANLSLCREPDPAAHGKVAKMPFFPPTLSHFPLHFTQTSHTAARLRHRRRPPTIAGRLSRRPSLPRAGRQAASRARLATPARRARLASRARPASLPRRPRLPRPGQPRPARPRQARPTPALSRALEVRIAPRSAC